MSESPSTDPVAQLQQIVAAQSEMIVALQGTVAAQQMQFASFADDIANNAALIGTLKQQIEACQSALVAGKLMQPLRNSSYVHESVN